ncbi:RnfH family protein [Rhodoferax sp.]|uniref:RnfH family protein n=1 Tax=Rhodoferax sp. TaxID=50421 RepID=UPI0039B86FB8
MHVTVVYSPGVGEMIERPLEVPPGCTLNDALRASGLLIRWPELASADTSTGVWGRLVGLDQCLQEGDRVEVYRSLDVDPKVSRRERFAKQGVRAAGLFARPCTAPKPAK